MNKGWSESTSRHSGAKGTFSEIVGNAIKKKHTKYNNALQADVFLFMKRFYAKRVGGTKNVSLIERKDNLNTSFFLPTHQKRL